MLEASARDRVRSEAQAKVQAEAEAEDARAYEEFADGQDPLDIDAATWVARGRNGLDAHGEAELRDWLDADPRHRAAYDDMDGTFGRLRDMPAAEVQALKSGLRAHEAPGVSAPTPRPTQPIQPAQPVQPARPAKAPASTTRPASPGRRAWMRDIGRFFPQAATAAVAVSVVGGGWFGWDRWRHQPTFEKHYATARGQQLRAELPDGSGIAFDTATQADARLYRDRREVHLHEGQAMFSVHADPAQPFHVFAGGLRVTVVGTRFSVRHTRSGLGEGETRVVVEEGRVRVARHATPGPHELAGDAGDAVELTAGKSVVADSDGRLGSVSDVPPGSAAPWREGRVNFDNTPLSQALAEFERYGPTGFVVRDAAVARLRVGGSFQLQHFEAFAQSLPRQLPVRLQRRGSITEVVDAR
ncbi:FecR domain-containing protein [Variovorax sp. RCC_210]|uniref:FecR family protein n=1 Tax=Variovorax sp. RCC_210 TaxID=3239217 RepID=UPI003524F6C5